MHGWPAIEGQGDPPPPFFKEPFFKALPPTAFKKAVGNGAHLHDVLFVSRSQEIQH